MSLCSLVPSKPAEITAGGFTREAMNEKEVDVTVFWRVCSLLSVLLIQSVISSNTKRRLIECKLLGLCGLFSLFNRLLLNLCVRPCGKS